jgi:hypothetical protein
MDSWLKIKEWRFCQNALTQSGPVTQCEGARPGRRRDLAFMMKGKVFLIGAVFAYTE